MLINLIANFILRAYTLYLCILCSSAFSLTLGNLKLYSSLNQPLKASIEILNADNLAANEILPNLASADDFKLANLVRPDFLSNLECEIIANNKNKKIIFISTVDPIQHPSIEFLIEVHWPEGRILKEYSLLLSPYHTTSTSNITKESPTQKKIIQPQLKVQKTKAKKYAFYRTKKGDTLWSIASMVAENRRISVQQSMDLIFNSNPSAFIDGDKNKLQTDYKLKLPGINNNLNDKPQPKSTEANKASVVLNNTKSSNIDIKDKNSNQTSKKKLTSQKNMAITTSNAATDTTADAPVTNNISARATNTSENTELSVATSTQQMATAKNNQLTKSITDNTPTNYEVMQEASVVNTEQQQKPKDDGATKQQQPTMKEKFAAKKIASPVIKDNSFLNIYTLFIIILLICGLGFVLYRKQKKSTNNKSQESYPNNDEIIDDYSQVESTSNTDQEMQDKKDIKLNLTPIDRAEEFIAKDEPHKAILILNQALSINPEDPDLNFKLTELYCNIKDKDNARKMMANSLQLNNSNLNIKLEALKELFPNLFVQKAIEDEDSWGIDNIDSNADDMSNEEKEMISDISKSPKATDGLSFLENSELSAESTIDEIFKASDTNSESSKHNNFKPQNSKLDLARGYIDIGDNDEAIKLLNEIITSGTENEQQEAQQLLKNLEENNPN